MIKKLVLTWNSGCSLQTPGHATGHYSLDFWGVSRESLSHGCELLTTRSLKRQEDGTFADADLASILHNA
jgi:hypothetical protein